MFPALIAFASLLAGAIASVAGFGIGSLLTPVFQLREDMRGAVAAVSIPHFLATALRLWIMRRNVDLRVLKSFGLMSAAGGLTGAVLQRYATARSLTIVFAVLLTIAGVAGFTGLSERVRLGRVSGWIAGVLSGALGGLVGNQGGIRSAALLGYDLPPKIFVATATAAALLVDAARVPVYLITDRDELSPHVGLIVLASLGAVVGTLGGERVLRRLSPSTFRQLVGALVLLLGLYMAWRAT